MDQKKSTMDSIVESKYRVVITDEDGTVLHSSMLVPLRSLMDAAIICADEVKERVSDRR